ncbi:MAG: ABC transporter permease [Pseudomonadaceae bacterium]|nr:ABC transporter permease [Pseudomonadaceae bacterium]
MASQTVRLPLSLLARLSVRNLIRNARRTVLLLASVAVAVASVLVTASLIRGFQDDLADAVVVNLTGHLQVQAPGYRDDPGIDHRFELEAGWQRALDGLPVAGWASRIRVPAVIMSERETRGMTLVGVDAQAETISFLASASYRGEPLVDVNDRRVIIGEALADSLKTDVGRRLVLMAQGPDGRSREAGFRIAGVYDADGTALEKNFVFTGRTRLHELLETDAITELSVRLDDSGQLPAANAALASVFQQQRVFTWQELEPQAAAMYAYADLGIFIWFAIMMAALIFGLINTLVTAVMERVRELGMLRAVGMRAAAVVSQVVIESAVVMCLGVVLGVLIASLLLNFWLVDGIDLSQWAQGAEMVGMRSHLQPKVMLSDTVFISVLSVVVGVVASLYPARQAVRRSPLEALRAD